MYKVQGFLIIITMIWNASVAKKEKKSYLVDPSSFEFNQQTKGNSSRDFWQSRLAMRVSGYLEDFENKLKFVSGPSCPCIDYGDYLLRNNLTKKRNLN